MSTYDDSSLFLYPSGYKASVLFAQKPMDANGQLAFTRSNDTATRVASNGLIEKVRTNLVPNGLSFFAATGVLYTTVTSDSPISGVSSTRITKNEAAGTLRYGNQNASASALTGSISYTISRYFKYDGYNVTTSMEFNNSAQWGGISWTQNINIASTGVTLQAPTNCTSKITNVGNGWYRVDVTIVSGASPSGSPVTYLLKVDSTLSTGQGFLTAAPQLETGDIATDYILTTTAAVSVGPLANIPRIDYLGGGCGKLLLEPQRTNLLTYSESFNNASWVKIDTAVTANTTISPDGTQNADTMTTTASTSRVFGTLSTGAGTFTISCYVKRLTGNDNFQLRLVVDGVNQSQNFAVTSEWQRFTFTATAASSITSQQLRSAGAGTGTFAIWGAQFEAGAYATSYIPTLAASVTRGADLASAPYTGLTTTSGSLFIDLKKDFAGQNINSGVASLGLRLSSTGTNDSVGLRDATLGTFQGVMRVGGTSSNLGAVISGTAATKVCFVWTASTVKMFKDGALFGSASISTPAVFNTIELPNSTRTVSAPLSQFLIFPTALSDAEAIAITTL